MYISDIFGTPRKLGSGQLFPIRNNCSEFLRESKGYPVYKQLYGQYGVCSKVKVRHRSDPILEQFFSHTIDSKTVVETLSYPKESGLNYWIFPINGYRYVYNTNTVDYKTTINTIIEMTADVDVVHDLISDLYVQANLVEGLQTNTEILWYKISHFYAVDCSMFEDYNELLNLL